MGIDRVGLDEGEFTNQELHLRDIESKYKQLYEFAKTQNFVVLFRGEGSHVSRSGMEQMGTSESVTGTWYATTYEKAKIYYDQAVARGDEAKMYCVIVPELVMETQDDLNRASGEVNMALRSDFNRTEISKPEDAPEPTLENYMNQFDFVREYYSLKG